MTSSESSGCQVGCFLLLLLLLLLLGLPESVAVAAAGAAAAFMLVPVPCALKSTNLLSGCCCYVYYVQ